jgi:hypothetical protein
MKRSHAVNMLHSPRPQSAPIVQPQEAAASFLAGATTDHGSEESNNWFLTVDVAELVCGSGTRRHLALFSFDVFTPNSGAAIPTSVVRDIHRMRVVLV